MTELKLFLKKNSVRRVGLFFLGWLGTEILNLLFPSLKIWQKLVNATKSLLAIRIPDMVFLIILTTMIIWLLRLNKASRSRFGRTPKPERVNIKELMAKLNVEHFSILIALANAPEALEENRIYAAYKSAYQKERKDFKFIISDLINFGLIQYTFSVNESFFVITDLGLDIVREHLKKVK